MTTKASQRKDFVQIAHSVFQRASGEVEIEAETPAKIAARKGGLTGGRARSDSLTPEQRSEIAKKAAEARWKK